MGRKAHIQAVSNLTSSPPRSCSPGLAGLPRNGGSWPGFSGRAGGLRGMQRNRGQGADARQLLSCAEEAGRLLFQTSGKSRGSFPLLLHLGPFPE